MKLVTEEQARKAERYDKLLKEHQQRLVNIKTLTDEYEDIRLANQRLLDGIKSYREALKLVNNGEAIQAKQEEIYTSLHQSRQ